MLQNNIAFYLMLNIDRVYSFDSISSMRHDQESMDFWITFSKMFKGKGIDFLRGYNGKGLGRSGACTILKECQINFVVLSDTTLKVESSK